MNEVNEQLKQFIEKQKNFKDVGTYLQSLQDDIEKTQESIGKEIDEHNAFIEEWNASQKEIEADRDARVEVNDTEE